MAFTETLYAAANALARRVEGLSPLPLDTPLPTLAQRVQEIESVQRDTMTVQYVVSSNLNWLNGRDAVFLLDRTRLIFMILGDHIQEVQATMRWEERTIPDAHSLPSEEQHTLLRKTVSEIVDRCRSLF